MESTSKHGTTKAGVPTAARPAPCPAPATLEPLILEMRRAGIASGSSGPDDGLGRAWVEFPAASSLRDFLNAAASYSQHPATIYARLPWVGRAGLPEKGWEVETWVEDLARYKDAVDPHWPEDDRPPELRLCHTLHVPHADLADVMAGLREHNRRARR